MEWTQTWDAKTAWEKYTFKELLLDYWAFKFCCRELPGSNFLPVG